MAREMTALGLGDGMRLKARIEHAGVDRYRARFNANAARLVFRFAVDQ
jgi:hypothetical protein